MIKFLRPSEKHLPQLKEMCAVCFNEEISEVEFVFNNYISTEICYCIAEDEKLISALYLVPCSINFEERLQGHYLYGASTLPNYRGKGYMRRLINYALENAKQNGDRFSALLPAEKSLYNYYERLGYESLFTAKCFTIEYDEIEDFNDKDKLLINSSFDNIQQLRFNICKGKFGTVNWGKNILDFAVSYAKVENGNILCCDKGYIIYMYMPDMSIFVSEFMCQSDDFRYMLFMLKENVKAYRYVLRLPPWINCKQTAEQFGMIKFLTNKNISNKDFSQAYLGLTFD